MIPRYRKIQTGDSENIEQQLENITGALNDFMEEVNQVFKRGITLEENLNIQIQQMVKHYGGNFPYTFNVTTRTKPVAVVLGKIKEHGGNYLQIGSAVQIEWYLNNNNEVVIDIINGIDSSKYYDVTLLVFGG